MKKVVYFFSAFAFASTDKRIEFEREVRGEILCQNKDNICLEICHTSSSGVVHSEVKKLIKKKVPHVVVFHECPDAVVQSHTKHISKELNELPLFLHKPKPGEKGDGTSHEITQLKDVALFLTAV